VICSLLRDCAEGMAVIIITIIIIIIIIIIITAIEFSLGGSSPYTSTEKTNKNKYT
jgi:uncharacterized protein YpmB